MLPRTTSHALIILAASFGIWPMLFAASWMYFPLPIAAISSAVHLVGLILTGWPSLVFICGNSYAPSSDLDPGRIASESNPFDSFPDHDEARTRPYESDAASRTTSRDLGSSLQHDVAMQNGNSLPQFIVDRDGVRLIAEGCSSLDFPTYWRLIPELSPEDFAEAGFTLTKPVPLGDDCGAQRNEASGAGEEEAA